MAKSASTFPVPVHLQTDIFYSAEVEDLDLDYLAATYIKKHLGEVLCLSS